MNSLATSTLEEIKELIIEGESAARGMLISTYLQVGNLILENNLTAQLVANYIGRSERTVEYMVAFAKKPEIADKLGKNDTWTSVVKNYLTTHKEKKEHEHSPISICSTCRKKLD